MKNRILASVLVSIIVLSGGTAFAKELPSMNINDLDAYYRKDTLMLPLRKIAEGVLGYEVIWNGEEKSVEIQKGDQWTKIIIDENSYFFARVAPFGLSKAPELNNSLTYVPVEFFSEVLKYDISLEEDILTFKEPVEKAEEIIFNGFIKNIDKEIGRVLVLGDGTSEDSDYIWLTKIEESEILNEKGENIPFENLKLGNKVIVTMPEMVALSYPAQGSLIKIVVLEDKSFEIVNKEIKGEENNVIIKYPEIKGMEIKVIEDNLNQKIESFVSSIKENYLYKDLNLDYEINLINDNKISFL